MTITRGNETWGRLAELWSLREDVRVELGSVSDPVRLSGPWGEVAIQRPSAYLREALYRMRLGPILLENVVSSRHQLPVAAQQVELVRVLERLRPLIIRTLGFESGRLLLSIVPITPRSRFDPVTLAPDARVRLSAFAELRASGEGFVMESPLANYRVLLHRAETVFLVGTLGRPTTVAACGAAVPQLAGAVADVLAYLVAAQMVVVAEQPDDKPAGIAGFTEDTDPALAGWSPTDLMFHTRSTSGRHDLHYPRGSGAPEPVVKPGRAGGIPLYRPRWEELSEADPTLATAMEARRSMRSYGSAPVTAEDIGALLYRTARVRSLIVPSAALLSPPRPGGPDPRVSDRPYPGGGAGYELELYLTIGDCPGLPPGLFHYDPLGHRLEPVSFDRAAADELLAGALQAARMEIQPPVLLTMTARFRRLSAKHQGMAYAWVLMDVGVLMQSLYLVCTAMHLAPCAIGAVRTDAAARAFGVDWRAEPSVGQFIIGRYPDQRPSSPDQTQPVNDAEWLDLAGADLGRPPAY